MNAFVALKDGTDPGEQTRKDLILQVRKSIGPFAAPKAVFIVDDLPKTRSGKIMRRILRKILSGEEDSLGDITTLSDPSVVEKDHRHRPSKQEEGEGWRWCEYRDPGIKEDWGLMLDMGRNLAFIYRRYQFHSQSSDHAPVLSKIRSRSIETRGPGRHAS